MNGSVRSAKGWQTRKDKKALEGYEKQLRNRRKEYAQVSEAYSRTGRRNRALAVGECVLKLYEELLKLNQREKLLDGTLFWTVNEQRLRDVEGEKGFRYVVSFHVKSEEPYYTEQEIAEEIEKTRKQMQAEKDEFYTEDEDGPDEADLVPEFMPDTEPVE